MDLQNPTTSIKHSRVLSKMDARQIAKRILEIISITDITDSRSKSK